MRFPLKAGNFIQFSKSYSHFSLENVFSNDGLLASLIPNYDFRKNQYSLAEDYAKNIVESAVMVAEADTGIGKTFSYSPVTTYALSSPCMFELISYFLLAFNHEKNVLDAENL